MALRGVQRATLDADFILLSDDLEKAHQALTDMGYQREFKSENVSHYLATNPELGRVDLLHAFRDATRGMLERAERLEFNPHCTIPVVHLEDLIGLKVQAAHNDPERETGDWADIHSLIRHAAQNGNPIDWELLAEYFELFNRLNNLEELKQLHGTTPKN